MVSTARRLLAVRRGDVGPVTALAERNFGVLRRSAAPGLPYMPAASLNLPDQPSPRRGAWRRTCTGSDNSGGSSLTIEPILETAAAPGDRVTIRRQQMGIQSGTLQGEGEVGLGRRHLQSGEEEGHGMRSGCRHLPELSVREAASLGPPKITGTLVTDAWFYCLLVSRMRSPGPNQERGL